MKTRQTARSWASPKVVALVSAVLVVTAACGSTDSAANGDEPTKVNVYYTSPLTQNALASVAADNNLFPDDVDVKVEGGDSTVGVTLASSGRTQFYINTAPMTENIAHGGAKLKWAASWQDGLNGLFIGRDGVKTLADMKGRTLGIAQPGLTLSVIANSALVDAGVESGDYKTVSLGTVPAMAGAFAAGSIQGVVLDRMSAMRLLDEVEGSQILFDYATDMPFVGTGVSVNTDWLAKNEDAAISVLKGLQAALQLIFDDPDAAKPSISKVTGIQPGKELDAVVQDFIDHSNRELKPVSNEQLEQSMNALQLDGNEWATMDFGKTVVIDPKYLDRALGK